MRRGLFVYCRRTLRRRQHNDDRTAYGSVGEAQPAPDGGVDDDGGRDEQKYGVFDEVTARTINVTNDAADIVVTLGVNDSGGGLVYSQSAKGNDLMTLTSTVEG